MQIVTYQINQAINCQVNNDMVWLAYIVLPNGEFWGVRFNGATEEVAKAKAISLWNSEKDKWKHREPYVEPTDDPWADAAKIDAAKQHHLAGKVWMKHNEYGLKRVALTEISMYEKQGYYRSGPRSK